MTTSESQRPIPLAQAAWDPDEPVVVSVFCATYNHAPFIRDCLEGFLAQETTFRVRVLVHDDASTDGTTAVVREYAERYPHLITAICQRENQMSRGRSIVTMLAEYIEGEFVASCEGDDQWCDPHKLQRQVEALRRHPQCDLCSHPSFVDDVSAGTRTTQGMIADHEVVLPITRVLGIDPIEVATSSRMVRVPVWRDLLVFLRGPEGPHVRASDVLAKLFGARRGGFAHLPQVMSVYRLNVPGSWTRRVKQVEPARRSHSLGQLRAFCGHARRTRRTMSHEERRAVVEQCFLYARDAASPRRVPTRTWLRLALQVGVALVRGGVALDVVRVAARELRAPA